MLSCEKGMVVFYVYDSTETTIQGQSPVNLPFNIPIPKVKSNNIQEYENNNTAPNLIKEVILEYLSINIISPDNEDFSFLKSLKIFIKVDDNDNSPLLIAHIDNISSTAKSIELTTTNENLVKYLKNETYQLETEAEIKEYLTHDVDIKINLKFKVKAKVL